VSCAQTPLGSRFRGNDDVGVIPGERSETRDLLSVEKMSEVSFPHPPCYRAAASPRGRAIPVAHKSVAHKLQRPCVAQECRIFRMDFPAALG